MFTQSLPRTLAGALLLSGAATAQAATLLVTVKADAYDGVCNLHCSLRDAVAVANQSGTTNTILLPSGTYKLTRLDPLDGAGLPIDEDGNLSGDLDVVGELRIKGAGAGKTVIKGPSDDYRVVNHRLIEVPINARLKLERLTLKNGHSAYNGGAVENHGRLHLLEVMAESNLLRAHDSPGNPEAGRDRNGGGAIANYGDLVVQTSHFESNITRAGVYTARPTMGGAIYNRGNLSVRDSHFQNNSNDDQGGAGSAIYNKGRATIERSSFLENAGMDISEGAIANEGGVLMLTNSTLSGNWNSAVSNGLHDTVPGERSSATLTNVTITRNGMFWGHAVENSGELSIRNSVIAGNPDGFSGPDANCLNDGPNFSYQAIGLLMNGKETNCTADLFVPLEQTFTQVLSPAATQQSNGTWVHALIPASPAIDAGVGDCVSVDQRGVSRPKDGNGDGVAVCDLGAYELKP